MQVSYSDTAPLRQVIREQVIATIGRIVFLGSELLVGFDSAPLRFQLTDSDMGLDIRASTDRGADLEFITVNQTSVPGTFTGSIPTRPAIVDAVQQYNGVLEVSSRSMAQERSPFGQFCRFTCLVLLAQCTRIFSSCEKTRPHTASHIQDAPAFAFKVSD